MHLDPLSGYLFVFKNKRGDRLKCVFWDTDSFAMFYKVLQKGTFQFPDLQRINSAGLEIEPSILRMILDGIDLVRIRKHQRYQLPQVISLNGEASLAGFAH
jgi:transposase